jgi:hypothetical protein
MTTLIMTPLPEEFDFFIQGIQARGVHYTGCFSGCDCRGAMAVARECAGAARASRLTGVPHVAVRGITDSADHDAPGSFE